MQCISCPPKINSLRRRRSPRSGRGFLAVTAHFMRFNVLGTCSVPGRTKGEICLTPAALKANARVENGQGDDSEYNHGAFEDHICDFIVGQLAVKALFQFRHTEARSYKDEDCGSKEGFKKKERVSEQPSSQRVELFGGEGKHTKLESLENGGVAHFSVRGVKAGFVAVGGETKIGAKAYEEEERSDLEGQTSNHDINASLLR